MIRFSTLLIGSRPISKALAVLVLCSLAQEKTFANSQAASSVETAPEIEYASPDGQVRAVPPAGFEDKSGNTRAILTDDNSIRCPLKEGDTTFIIALAKTSPLDRFTFVNENAAAEGTIGLAVSNDRLPINDPKWVEVEGNISFTRKRLFGLSMVGVEARYVRVSFHVEDAGRIAAAGLRNGKKPQDDTRGGSVTPGAYRNPLADALNFNFANLYAHARIVYVSSGSKALARRMIDDNTLTAFRFSPVDAQPTVIVELASRERLHRVSAIYKMETGRLDVYLLNELHGGTGDLAGMAPVASVADTAGGGTAAVNFDPSGARYVALRWTPEPARTAVGPFEVLEINAFGDVSRQAALSTKPELLVSNASAFRFP